MVFKVFLISAFLALTSASVGLSTLRIVAAAPTALVSTPVLAKISEDTVDPNPSYSFAYDVQDSLTGDSKGHIESRANGIVQGQYNVAEPDGTRRIVDYTADPINGFNALVRKEPLVVAAQPLVQAAQPVIAARAAKVLNAPLAAPLVTRTAPLIQAAQPAHLVAQSAPIIAQANPVIAARAAHLIAAQGLTSPIVTGTNFIAGSPYVLGASPSSALLARSFNVAPAPLNYAVV